jgi:predicted DNA-binding transcriptional regulator AlpA
MPTPRKAKPAARRARKAAPPLITGPGDELVTPAQLEQFGIRYSSNWLCQLWQRGDFPVPRRLSARRYCWTRRQLEEWIAAREPVTRTAR